MSAARSSSRLRHNQSPSPNGGTVRPWSTRTASPQSRSPYLPTPTEALVFGAYPAVLLFGSLYSIISPETRAAPYDPVAQAHRQDPSMVPSYFARKNNVVNQAFVKKGWAWMTAAFLLFAATHSFFSAAAGGSRRLQAFLRFAAVTAAWIFVTQWFFGPALIDRGFRLTGGRCDVAVADANGQTAEMEGLWSASACKARGGKWNGGHDISGHIFLLVLGSGALLQEVGWVLWNTCGTGREERLIVMPDGAVKSAAVEIQQPWQRRNDENANENGGVGAKFAAGVVGVSIWMMLMTAVYFHTWVEKVARLFVLMAWRYANQCSSGTVYWPPRCADVSLCRLHPPTMDTGS